MRPLGGAALNPICNLARTGDRPLAGMRPTAVWIVALAMLFLVVSSAHAIPVRVLGWPPNSLDIIFQRDLRERGIDLEIVRPSFFDIEQMTEAIASGSYDLVYLPAALTRSLIEQGVLAPLDPYLSRDRSFSAQGPYGLLLDEMRVGGQLYELPVAMDPIIMMVNPDLFAARGMEPPGPGWTWEDFRQLAAAFAHDTPDGRRYGVITSFDAGLLFIIMLAQSGHHPFDMSDDLILSGLEMFNDMLRFGRTLNVVSGPATSSHFQLSETPMQINSLSAAMQITRVLPRRWRVAPLPSVDPRDQRTVADLVNIGIPASASNPDAAWRTASYLAGADGQRRHALAVTPARLTAESLEARLDSPLIRPPEGGLEFLLGARFLPTSLFSEGDPASEFLFTVWQAAQSVFSGERSPAQVMPEIRSARERLQSAPAR